ncbi:hypothetical protein, partial [Vibrio cholerae]
GAKYNDKKMSFITFFRANVYFGYFLSHRSLGVQRFTKMALYHDSSRTCYLLNGTHITKLHSFIDWSKNKLA